jgi:hypothetical protein
LPPIATLATVSAGAGCDRVGTASLGKRGGRDVAGAAEDLLADRIELERAGRRIGMHHGRMRRRASSIAGLP